MVDIMSHVREKGKKNTLRRRRRQKEVWTHYSSKKTKS